VKEERTKKPKAEQTTLIFSKPRLRVKISIVRFRPPCLPPPAKIKENQPPTPSLKNQTTNNDKSGLIAGILMEISGSVIYQPNIMPFLNISLSIYF
jgi:hypothetical protein